MTGGIYGSGALPFLPILVHMPGGWTFVCLEHSQALLWVEAVLLVPR